MCPFQSRFERIIAFSEESEKRESRTAAPNPQSRVGSHRQSALSGKTTRTAVPCPGALVRKSSAP